MKKEEPLLSVRLMTYNHEEYIAQAVESCVMQVCDFKFEVVIGDDFSTDKTLEIALKYQKKYPEIVRVLTREKGDDYYVNRQKKGRLFNFIDIVNNCKGRYIALLDGDDYWTDPYKLQKQVDLMESDENCNICYHRVGINQNGDLLTDEKDITERRYNQIQDKSALNITTLLEYGNFIHTCSVFFRKSALNFPFEMLKSTVGDYLLYIILTKDGGHIRKIEESMAVYRRGIGVYSSLNKQAMSHKILMYQTCILSLLEKEEHRKIMLYRVMKRQQNLFKEADYNNLSFKTLSSLLFQKVKNKLK